MRTLHFRAVLAVLVVVGVLAGTTWAIASNGETEEYDPSADVSGSAEDALRESAEMIAKQEGLSTDAAFEMLQFQLQVGDYIGEVLKEYPDLFAGSKYDGNGPSSGRAVIKFKGPVPYDVALRMPPPPSGIRLEGGSAFSEAEMSERTAIVYYHLLDLGVPPESLEVAGADDQIVVRVTSANLLGAADVSALRSVLREALGASAGKTVDGDIIIQIDSNAGIVTEHSYGRDNLWGGISGHCVTAFSVTGGGVNGVLTAGHCGAWLTHYQPEVGSLYTITYQNHKVDFLGDAGWYSTAHTEYDDFYTGPGTRQDVASYRPKNYMSPNDWVCFWGRWSGTAVCRQIDNTNICGTTGACSLIRLTGSTSLPGDSGGPWYLGNIAYGIHTGSSPDGTTYSYFSTVDFALVSLNVSLMQ